MRRQDSHLLFEIGRMCAPVRFVIAEQSVAKRRVAFKNRNQVLGLVIFDNPKQRSRIAEHRISEHSGWRVNVAWKRVIGAENVIHRVDDVDRAFAS